MRNHHDEALLVAIALSVILLGLSVQVVHWLDWPSWTALPGIFPLVYVVGCIASANWMYRTRP